MKKCILIFSLLLVSFSTFADGEQVWVVTNTGSTGFAKTPSDLGFISPCITLSFYVNINIPPDYVTVSKFEWFVNGISVYTNTTDLTNPTYDVTIVSRPTSVYCKVK